MFKKKSAASDSDRHDPPELHEIDQATNQPELKQPNVLTPPKANKRTPRWRRMLFVLMPIMVLALVVGVWLVRSHTSNKGPSIVGTNLSSSDLNIGSLLTISSTIKGSWTNPDDPSQINVSGEITTPSGAVQTIPGFFYQGFMVNVTNQTLVPSGSPDWKIRYTPQTAGVYSIIVSAKTGSGESESASYRFTVNNSTASGYHGFVQVDTTDQNYYQYSASKQSFFGVGADLDFPEFTRWNCPPSSACLSANSPMRGLFGDGTNKPATGETSSNLYLVYQSYMTAIKNLAANGANSGRLRLDSRFLPLELSSSYSGIPGYPHGVSGFSVGEYNAANAWIADQVISQADKDGMALQLTTWNANQLDWGDSYATDQNSTLIKSRLRYEVARWGYSPGVLSWEFFNELGNSSKNSMTSSFWVNQINFLKSIDTNHHIITNSYQGIQTSEHHVYTGKSQDFAVLTKFLPGDIPHNTSEYGQDAFYNLPPGYDPNGVKAHEGLWASLMGRRSGAWYWWLDEQIAPDNLYGVFHGISAFTSGENLGSLNWTQASFTQVSGPGGLNYYGMVGSDGHALVWIERTTSQSLTDNLPANGNAVKLHGLEANKSYTIQWWNTESGTITGTASATSTSSGGVLLDVPNGVTRDIAAKVLLN